MLIKILNFLVGFGLTIVMDFLVWWIGQHWIYAQRLAIGSVEPYTPPGQPSTYIEIVGLDRDIELGHINPLSIWFVVYIGLFQFTYIVPLVWRLFLVGRVSIAIGVIVSAVLVALLNGLYFWLVFSSKYGIGV